MSDPSFCMNCFAPMSASDEVCAKCGAGVAEMSGRDYRQKLLHALDHPLADVRMRAVHALQLRAEPETADALAQCALKHPIDVVQGLLIVGALRPVSGSDAGRRAIERLRDTHPAHAVREAARVVLAHERAPDGRIAVAHDGPGR
jgi:hypothetical protein